MENIDRADVRYVTNTILFVADSTWHEMSQQRSCRVRNRSGDGSGGILARCNMIVQK